MLYVKHLFISFRYEIKSSLETLLNTDRKWGYFIEN